MQLIKMKCSNCGAQLEVDLDHLQVYCPYCGQKLMMGFDQLASVLTEKEKTKQIAEKEEHETTRVKMAYDHESRDKEMTWKWKVFALKTAVLLLVFSMFAVYYFPERRRAAAEKKHNEKIAYLQQLEIEIEEDIKSGDYDSALIAANKLYCDDNWSSKQTATWDAKREAFIIMIEDKKREEDLKDPDNIFMPAESSSFEGKKYMDVVDQLKALGFTNITTQVASESPGFFNKNNTVEHILVGGKTEFTAEDYFNKDTPIIVYYYSK